MFCPKCGNNIPEGTRFCDSCGEPMVNSSSHSNNHIKRKSHSRKKFLIPLICILVLAIVATSALLLVTGKQTVYLMTKSEASTAQGITTVTTYEYDDDGRITKFEYALDNPDYYTGGDISQEISYSYDDTGLLESAEFESGDMSYTVEYVYKNGLLTGFEIEDHNWYSDMDLDIECDNQGLFELIKLSSGDYYLSWEFEYYDSGIVKEYEIQNGSDYVNWIRYDENGNTIENKTSYQNEIVSHVIYEYNERGYMTLMEQYTNGNNGKPLLVMSLRYEPVFEDDQMTELVMVLKMPGANNDLFEFELVFTCDWNGLECEMTLDDIRGDTDLLDNYDLDGFEMSFELNEAGNVLESDISIGGESYQSTSFEYEEFKVPRRFVKPSINDPKYLRFLANS